MLDGRPRIEPLRDVSQVAPELAQGEEFWTGERRSERHAIALPGGLEDLEHQIAHVHVLGPSRFG